jgi:hypothetical protein
MTTHPETHPEIDRRAPHGGSRSQCEFTKGQTEQRGTTGTNENEWPSAFQPTPPISSQNSDDNWRATNPASRPTDQQILVEPGRELVPPDVVRIHQEGNVNR